MRAAAAALAAISVGLTPALALADAPRGCHHPLTPVASANAVPSAVTGALPWIAFHGEPWNATDAITPGSRNGAYQWGARFGANWIVAYKVGGIACCSTRFFLFIPRGMGGGYIQAVRYPDQPDWFGDPTCAGIDAALAAYAGAR